ncbi:MAG: HIT family protein [Chlamydiota bacterium]
MCVFCDIVQGKAPCHQIWENDQCIAFLSIFPNTKALSVVALKEHYPSNIFSLELVPYQTLLQAAREVGRLLEKQLQVARCAMIAEGMGVAHAHLQIIPLHGLQKKQSNYDFERPGYRFDAYPGYVSSHEGQRADEKDLQRLAEKIRGKSI